jgi:polyisoprenoid-binding protein YceI
MNRFASLALVLSLSLIGASAAPETYTPDLAHSTVAFKVKHLGISTVTGQFKDYTGKVLFNKEEPVKSSVEIVVKTTSVDTANAKRDEHLRKTDFFDVAKYPTMSFKSTAVKKIDDTTYEVTGDFTLLAVTKPLTIQFTEVAFGKGMQGEDRAGGQTRFKIKRSDFGMNKMIGPVGDDIEIELSFEAIKSA